MLEHDVTCNIIIIYIIHEYNIYIDIQHLSYVPSWFLLVLSTHIHSMLLKDENAFAAGRRHNIVLSRAVVPGWARNFQEMRGQGNTQGVTEST